MTRQEHRSVREPPSASYGNCGKDLAVHPVAGSLTHADTRHCWCFEGLVGYDQPRASVEEGDCEHCGQRVKVVCDDHPEAEGGRYILDVAGRCPVSSGYHRVTVPRLAPPR